MPYVTSMERVGYKRGRAEMGRKAVLDFLKARFDAPLPSELIDMISRIEDPSVLSDLFQDAARVSSPNEFKRILEKRIAR